MPSQPSRRPPTTSRPPVRQELGKLARLWSLSLICAAVGALVVWRTDALLPGVSAFLITLAVLGPVLYLYERRRR